MKRIFAHLAHDNFTQSREKNVAAKLCNILTQIKSAVRNTFLFLCEIIPIKINYANILFICTLCSCTLLNQLQTVAIS